MLIHVVLFNHSDRTPQLPQTAIPRSRFAIAPPQLPKHSFFNEPQRHREHRERAIAPPQLPKQRTDKSALTLSHPLQLPNLPKSDSYGALRYRTPSTSQIAIPSSRFVIAPTSLQNI
ncbi:hypothetical protein [Dolichospermum sp. UHCC 0259]|uniref:hypothetical protein n=1 Tax=Dolichospermum sp. UHCC 0259 TaxID=2590010 RepID=UPI001445144E|nr:hypothetical protein [Dolichospermum sp. UHCC 0259]MTJ46429.1 hypothetical protein [Dolichospermum sp. UHCC 0259]